MVRAAPINIEALAECIEVCFEYTQTCSACADACLGEEQMRQLIACIRLNEVCADICATMGTALSRIAHADVIPTRSLLDACADVCARCAQESSVTRNTWSTVACARKLAIVARTRAASC